MNEDVKHQWVSALRSGGYKQAQDGLKGGGRFCCLGVLCDLAVKAGVAEGWRDDLVVHRSIGYSEIWDGNESSASLPTRKVLDWAGLGRDDSLRLAGLNDSGWSFERIANLIEEDL